jgi:hypothetical protein
MEGRRFDDLARAASATRSRRGALGLVAGAALTAAIAQINPLEARKKNKKKKKCRKLNQGCGGKKKCCKGLFCVDGTCGCPSGQVVSGGKCINPDPPECANDNDCGANEVCQNGACVPEPPECVNNNDCNSNEICQNGVCVPECQNNNDCGANEICQNGECVAGPECNSNNDCRPNEICDDGTCVCPLLELGGECVFPCDSTSDCPGECNSCLGTFPGSGQPRVVCVDQPFLLCDDAIACDQVDECPSGFICSFVDCGDGDGRCYPITCNG